jgi:hypothetical protein
MSRADLLALTPEALASLANFGLVKRAQRELGEGAGPSLAEDADGTVVGTFPDGIVARLPPKTPLKDAPCTCGATNVCRHRVAVALAYKPWHASALRPGDPAAVPQPGEASPSPSSWSPADIDDATLERTLGSKVVARARATLARGLLATLEHDGVPTARLPSCTVRFLVPNDVAYAKCDCALAGGGCEHLALAVWAFREGRGAATAAVVALGAPRAAPSHAGALEAGEALVRDILQAGVAQALPSPARFAELRARLERDGLTWVRAIVVDLEAALEGYHRRSALYGTREIAALLVELAARARCARSGGGELPPRFVLGEDEAPETLLEHVRLASVGARVRADERTRFADVYLVDPATATVMVLHKRWDFDPQTEPEDGPALARRPIAARVPLKSLAQGQVVSEAVTRRANRSIDLGTTRVARTSVTPQRGDWSALPAPVLVRDLEEHEARTRARPPRLLRPRVLAEEVHVVEVSAVRDVAYASAEQQLVAQMVDATGHPFGLVVRHRRVAPHALEAVAAALAKTVRFVSGDLVRVGSGWQLEPVAVVADDVVVPDIAGPVQAPVVPAFSAPTRADPIDAAMARAESALEEVCHAGVAGVSRGAVERMAGAAQSLDDVGVAGVARRIRAIEAAVGAGDRAGAAAAWVDAALRVALAREASG